MSPPSTLNIICDANEQNIQGQAYQVRIIGLNHNRISHLRRSAHHARREANTQAVGAILPEALNPESWTASGTELQKQGEAEIRAAKVEAEMGAVVDSAAGKLKS